MDNIEERVRRLEIESASKNNQLWELTARVERIEKIIRDLVPGGWISNGFWISGAFVKYGHFVVTNMHGDVCMFCLHVAQQGQGVAMGDCHQSELDCRQAYQELTSISAKFNQLIPHVAVLLGMSAL